MKRFSLIFLSALTIFMAGCSKDTPVDSNQEPWVSDLSLPVPIELGSSGFQFETKAEMVTEDNLSDASLWLYAIDKNTQLTGVTPTENKSILFINEKARRDDATKKIVFDNQKTWYYPYASNYNYTFYACHIGDYEPQILLSSAGSLYTKIDLNTCQSDILWAKAEAKQFSGLDGFNAKYMRKIKESGNSTEYLPKLEFKHLSTALTFEFETSGGDATADEQLKNVTIESLQLSNIPSRINLWIADSPTAAKPRAGTLDVQTGQETSYPVRMDCSKIKMGNVGSVTNLGTLFVMVPSEQKEIIVDMVVKVPLTVSGSEIGDPQHVAVKLKLTSGDANKAFLPGSHYSYKITMKSLEEVVITASVKDFIDGIEGDDSSAIVDGTPSDGGLVIE